MTGARLSAGVRRIGIRLYIPALHSAIIITIRVISVLFIRVNSCASVDDPYS
ncbi:MAG: hypothetical protein ACP5F3_03085 [Candidatus Syntrophosphaera sp.]